MNNKNTLFDVIDDSLGIDKRQVLEASEELKKIRESVNHLQPANGKEIDEIQKEIDADKRELKIFRLFGTSGIRGILKNIYSDIVREYADNTFMSPKLAYCYGRAYGRLISKLNIKRQGPQPQFGMENRIGRFPEESRPKGRDHGWLRSNGLPPGALTKTYSKNKFSQCNSINTEVRVNMDPRPSSFCMATLLCEGLLEEGIDVYFNGVASTPMGSLYDNSIIITASHNDIRYNGIKAFIHGIPITFEMEWEIESGFRLLDRLEKKGKSVSVGVKRGKIFNSIKETKEKYLKLGRKIIKRQWPQQEGLPPGTPTKTCSKKLKDTIMPLDLAFGAAGANILSDSPHKSISPQLKLLLETGIIVIGYGTERDGHRTNYRIGAAYPYGETPDAIGEGELVAFARGKYGYGDNKKGGHISRSFYFPVDYAFKETSLKEEAIQLDDAYVFIDVDSPSNKNLLSKILQEVEKYELLPACSVDCDEDRFLATSPALSKKQIPYLSGDLMIMLFAANLQGDIKKVVFTVESGLSIGKYLEKNGIEYEEVTVGDRAIADYIMDEEMLEKVKPEERHKIAGGEPSGHMMFGAIENEKMILIDDPIITQLKILGLMRKTGRSFDTLLNEISDEVEEVFTARKPEAWAGEANGKGISLKEKIKLELRERGKEKVILTEYAKKFIPEYIEIFSEGYIEAYYKNIPENLSKYPEIQKSISLSDEYNKLLNEGKTISGLIEHLSVGKIEIKTEKGDLIEEVEIRLRLTNKDWAGPADINLSFYSRSGKLPQPNGAAAPVSRKNFANKTECNRIEAQEKEKQLCLAGGVVTRNSGTSPKNSAYNKLWFEHFPTGHKTGNDIIEKVTTIMAQKRVEFTNRFIEGLRAKT